MIRGGPAIRVLVTGGGGQLARSLCRTVWPAGWHVFALDRRTLDISNRSQVVEVLNAAPWSLIVNAAAFTDVDAAETRSAEAFGVNAEGPGWLARAARMIGAPIIHVSTDYVFDGTLARPYRETDRIAPIRKYGRRRPQNGCQVRSDIAPMIGWTISPVSGAASHSNGSSLSLAPRYS